MEEDLNLDLLFEEPAVVADVEGEPAAVVPAEPAADGADKPNPPAPPAVEHLEPPAAEEPEHPPLNNRDERNGRSRSRSRSPARRRSKYGNVNVHLVTKNNLTISHLLHYH